MAKDEEPWERLLNEVVKIGERGRQEEKKADAFDRSFDQWEKDAEQASRAREAHRMKQGAAIESIIKGLAIVEVDIKKDSSSQNLIQKAKLLDNLLTWNASLPAIAFDLGHQSMQEARTLLERALAQGHDAGDLNCRLDDLHFHFAEFCGAQISQLLEKTESDCSHQSYPIGQNEIRKRASLALSYAIEAVAAIECVKNNRPRQELVFCSMESVDPASILERKEGDKVIVATDARTEELQAIYFLMVELQVMLGDDAAARKFEEMANKLYKTHWPKSLKRGEAEPAKSGLLSRLFPKSPEVKTGWTKVGASREKWMRLAKGVP